jgi:two-component sensor histidine kinase
MLAAMTRMSGRDVALAVAAWAAATSLLTAVFAANLEGASFAAVVPWVSAHTLPWLAIGLVILEAVLRTSGASRGAAVAAHALGATAVAVLQPIAQLAVMRVLGDVHPLPPVFVRPAPFMDALPGMIWAKLPASLATYAALALAAHLLVTERRAAAEATRRARLESAARDAQLQALSARLQPHFLFNALHSVSTLIDEDPEAARQTLVRLSDLLRRTLETATRRETPLREEIEWVETYLAIEKARYEDRLAVEVDAEPELMSTLVPALVLQPLVENAVKHGIAACEAGGRIAIRARRQKDGLRLEVVTELRSPPERVAGGHGLGLDLTRSRLELLDVRPGTLEVTRDERRHTVAVTLPLQSRVA